MRRLVLSLAGPSFLMLSIASGPAVPTGAATTSSVRTVLGPSVVDSPGGLAVDATGDLFVADTDGCRVVEVPARNETIEGRPVPAGGRATLAGGSCAAGGFGRPTGVAVDGAGDVYVAEASDQRVLEVRPGGRATLMTVAGTGRAGFNGDGLAAPASQLDEPTDVAVEATGDLFIADTANCRVRVLPARNETLFGRTLTAGHLSTVAGTGVCGTEGQGGPAPEAELWNPVALAVDTEGDLLVADRGDQSVLLAAAHAGTFYGTTIGAGDIGVVVGGTGSYGPYLADGLPATGPAAELNDPRGLAVGPTGALFMTDGLMHVIRVVPASTGTLFGRPLASGDLYTLAGAVPVTSAAGLGDGTRWVLTRMDLPFGIAVSSGGVVTYTDAGLDAVRQITAAAPTP